jgi:hypothetical protein
MRSIEGFNKYKMSLIINIIIGVNKNNFLINHHPNLTIKQV